MPEMRDRSSCLSELRLLRRARANACVEPQAERVKEKDRANYCDFFRFKEGAQIPARGIREWAKKSGKAEAEKLWKELFKKR